MAPRRPRPRLDELLVARGLLPDLPAARAAVLAHQVRVAIVAGLFRGPARLVCLVKPLFEGVRREDAQRLERMAEPLERVRDAARARGLVVSAALPSPLFGSHGTLEFLVHLEGGARAPATDPYADALDEAARLLARKPA